MKRRPAGAVILLFSFALCASAARPADVRSLRGGLAPDAPSRVFEKRKQDTNAKGFGRAWKLQPPLISHKIDKDRINLNENTCLSCHAEEETVFSGAPPTPPSHSLDARGKKVEGVSRLRYFCTQCHVPQVRAEPLVENSF